MKARLKNLLVDLLLDCFCLLLSMDEGPAPALPAACATASMPGEAMKAAPSRGNSGAVPVGANGVVA